MPPSPDPVLLFDGDCALCHRAVRFILRHEKRPVIRFAPLQSDAGRALLAGHGFAGTLPDTLILISPEGVFVKSRAVVKVACFLLFPYSMGACLRLLPVPVADWLYDLVARHRHRLGGSSPHCDLPGDYPPERFLR